MTLSEGGDMSPVHRLRSESKYVLPLPPVSREREREVQRVQGKTYDNERSLMVVLRLC